MRRTVIEVVAPGAFGEVLELATFCGGTGARWAERRVSIRGDRGAQVEAATLWVHVDPSTLRPKRLPAQFHELFAEAALGRVVRPNLGLGDPAGAGAGGEERRPWPLRYCDYDVLGHVNNAAYWQVVEEEMARWRDLQPPLRAVLEFRTAVGPAAAVEVAARHDDCRLELWLMGAGDVVHAAGAVETPGRARNARTPCIRAAVSDS